MEKTFDFDKLSLVDIVQKRIAIDNYDGSENGIEHFDMDIGIELLTNLEDDILVVVYYVKFIQDDEDRTEMADFQIDFYFLYKNLQDLTTIEGDQVILNKELAKEVNHIAYSTSRGIIAVETRGTILEKLILPLIPSESLLSNTIQDWKK